MKSVENKKKCNEMTLELELMIIEKEIQRLMMLMTTHIFRVNLVRL